MPEDVGRAPYSFIFFGNRRGFPPSFIAAKYLGYVVIMNCGKLVVLPEGEVSSHR